MKTHVSWAMVLWVMAIVASCAAVPSVGFADGKVVPPRDYVGSLEEKAQEAMIVFHGSEKAGGATEELILKIRVEGDAERFAWVIPFPSEPKIAKEDPRLFQELFEYVEWRNRRPTKSKSEGNAAVGSARPAADDKPVDVLSRQVVGEFDVAVVRENVRGGLNPWLKEEGFQTLEDADDVLEFYRDKKYVFACIKVSSQALGSQPSVESHPLRFTFSTGGRDGIYFPMKMTSLQTEPFDVNLYVFYRYWINDKLSRYGYRHRGFTLRHRDWDSSKCVPNGGKSWSLPDEDPFLSSMSRRIPTLTRYFQKLHPGQKYYLTNIQAAGLRPADVRQWADDLWLFPYYTDRDMVPYDARPGGPAHAAWTDVDLPKESGEKKQSGWAWMMATLLSLAVAVVVLVWIRVWRSRHTKVSVAAVAAALLTSLATTSTRADWPQAAGPNHDYVVNGRAPTEFSATTQQNIAWRTPLPNTGESTPVVANGRLFITCHTPMTADAQAGREIFGMCYDARTGRELWRRTLPATRSTDMASGFSDNTAASPVTDGKHVCFVNVGGSIRTYDYSGELIWKHDWVPFGRHHARQQEPILHAGKVILLKTVASDLPVAATTKEGAIPLGRGKQYWTRLHAFDLATGQLQWVSDAGTSVHSASLLGTTVAGQAAILTGRGGGHQPPEEPYGLSLISADTGQTIWELPINGYAAHQNAVWRGERGAAFVGMQHYPIDMARGKLLDPVSLVDKVQLWKHQSGRYVKHSNARLPKAKRNRAITYHTNGLVGDHHYFRTHNDFLIGRVNIASGRVEYLQVPVQVVRQSTGERHLWDAALENDVKNNAGFVVCQDRRAKLNGWGHVSAASPIVIGKHLYMPTMIGMVYVLRWDAPQLDESALVSISDLGPAGQTWTLSSLAYSDGRIYARTLKELICIAYPQLD